MAELPLLHDGLDGLRDRSLDRITDELCRSVESRAGLSWWMAFGGSALVATAGLLAVIYQIHTGIGTWGLNRSVGWALDITNFVFWIGIGHAGTFISAILYLLRQRWRIAISRSAEAATLLAVICAAIFPLIHLGRPWLAFWMLPYPNFRGPLWINFRSPLVWDFFAIGTYFCISLAFFYLGLLPDLATLRDRGGCGRWTRILGWASLGWDGSQSTWHRWQTLYLLLAGLATALVVSVHTIVSWDFAVSILPGWHSTIFPPYFVLGAIFSGLAMVMTLVLIARKALGLEAFVTPRHVELMSKVVLFCSCFIGLVYLLEIFHALYSGDAYEVRIVDSRLGGPMQIPFGIMVVCNVLLPQLFWFRGARLRGWVVFPIVLLVNVGMWFERFTIVAGSLERDFLPSSWMGYTPTIIELLTLAGTFGLFFCGFLLFCRLFPVIPISETKAALIERQDLGEAGTAPAKEYELEPAAGWRP